MRRNAKDGPAEPQSTLTTARNPNTIRRVNEDRGDAALRIAVFAFLSNEERARGGADFPRALLEAGIEFQGRRVPLLGPQGIWKPAVAHLPISITTAPPRQGQAPPYDDEFSYDGLSYRYRRRQGAGEHRDNVGLREAMLSKVPLVYFHGHRPGLYHAEWPLYVVGDDPRSRTFTLIAEERLAKSGGQSAAEPLRRAYLARMMQQRLHQSRFRALVLDAYGSSCAVCRLRHRELLDAAHIAPDGHPRGEPVVTNGLSLCRLHHGAFDAQLIGITPNYVVEVRQDVLEETDGPMLRHGLQGVDRQPLIIPRRREDRPDRELLEERYDLFRKAV